MKEHDEKDEKREDQQTVALIGHEDKHRHNECLPQLHAHFPPVHSAHVRCEQNSVSLLHQSHAKCICLPEVVDVDQEIHRQWVDQHAGQEDGEPTIERVLRPGAFDRRVNGQSFHTGSREQFAALQHRQHRLHDRRVHEETHRHEGVAVAHVLLVVVHVLGDEARCPVEARTRQEHLLKEIDAGVHAEEDERRAKHQPKLLKHVHRSKAFVRDEGNIHVEHREDHGEEVGAARFVHGLRLLNTLAQQDGRRLEKENEYFEPG